MARGLPLNPISVGSGMTYLTFLYHRGLRWRSFDISRSAVSQTLPKWMVSPLGVAPVWFILWRASSTNAHLLVAASLCGILTTFSDLSPLGLDHFLSAPSFSGRPSWSLLQLVVDYLGVFLFVWTTTSSSWTILHDSFLLVSARRIGLIICAANHGLLISGGSNFVSCGGCEDSHLGAPQPRTFTSIFVFRLEASICAFIHRLFSWCHRRGVAPSGHPRPPWHHPFRFCICSIP